MSTEREREREREPLSVCLSVCLLVSLGLSVRLSASLHLSVCPSVTVSSCMCLCNCGYLQILLLVTPDFANDEYLSGFTVHQAQRCITNSLPNRVIVLMLEHPNNLPPMLSLERLLRMIPERNVLHARRNTPADHEIWRRLAQLILE